MEQNEKGETNAGRVVNKCRSSTHHHLLKGKKDASLAFAEIFLF